MYFLTLSKNDLGKRLDPGHYCPELLKMKYLVEKHFKSISFSTACKRMNSGPFGSALHASSYVNSENGVIFIRPQDCKDLIVNTNNKNVFISHSDHNRLKSSQFSSGSIIITKIGNGIGDMAIVPTNITTCNISGNAMGAILKDYDPYCAIAYLRSKYGQAEVKRGLSGGPKPKIDMGSISDIIFPLFQNKTQKYIGDKVRQAEQLREWANQKIKLADRVISKNFIYAQIPSMRENPHFISPKLLTSISLGPEFTRGLEGQKTFGESINFSEVLCSCKCGDAISGDNRIQGEYPYYGASGPIDTHNSYNFEGEFLIIAQDGSIGCTNISRGKIWANNHVWVVKIKDEFDLDTIAHFLKKHFPYWKSITTGSVVPKITQESLYSIKIPTVIAQDKTTGSLLRKASIAKESAKMCVELAKFLVEKLIEGQIIEQQLIDAQNALEAGDNSLDRDILSRVTDKGVAIEGKPLFDDLDKLYDLLQESQEAIEQKGDK
ncbi:restriction endonuclease subunit S [Legionella pneumophila]|nr:restriction endonuclease subunit S [Legionella pneumophila]